MDTIITTLPPDSFVRADETEDMIFYAKDRMVDHLDSLALQTIEGLVGRLMVDDSPAILDLMASCDSHIPNSVKASRIVGLGLNERELASNTVLDEYVIHDVNKNPTLPFDDETFDVILNTVSVDYMTQPVQVFAEVGRILKPGGLFLVMFSNRYFQAKVVKVWRHATGKQRIQLVELFLTTRNSSTIRPCLSPGVSPGRNMTSMHRLESRAIRCAPCMRKRRARLVRRGQRSPLRMPIGHLI
jgi:SAM-dependent methyltransferase